MIPSSDPLATGAAAVPAPLIFCFGEALWDLLPFGRFPGGAPLNVAYHLERHGLDSWVISAVGSDRLGDELLNHLEASGLDLHGITRLGAAATGTVNVTVGLNGEPAYKIANPVAWDEIFIRHEVVVAAPRVQAVVFGSLAQRSAANRRTLDLLLSAVPSHAERVFDVNLRPLFDDRAIISQRAKQATLLKLNISEAAWLTEQSNPRADNAEQLARLIAQRWGCRAICITAGAHGAGLLADDVWHWEHGRPVIVADAVGAGDAFLAALLAHRLRKDPAEVCLRAACRLGEWVASQHGATPAYPTAVLESRRGVPVQD